MKQYFILICLTTTFFNKAFGRNINTQTIDINTLSKIRSDHFEYGKPFDSVITKKAINSSDKIVKRYALGLQGLYMMEQFKKGGDSIWLEISDSTWFKDPKSKNQEFLLIDDLFRFSIATQRYMIIYNIINILYNLEFDRFHGVYCNILYLKTSNYYKFLELQDILRTDFINNSSSFSTIYSSDVIKRYKLNIVATNIANYDTINNYLFYKYLVENRPPINSNNLEDIVYNCSLSNYILSDSSNYRKNYQRLITELFSKKYIPPYILTIIYRNLNLSKEVKRYLYNHSFDYLYGKTIGTFLSLNFYLFDKQEFIINATDNTMFYGRYLDRVENKFRELPENDYKNITNNLSKIDSISSFYWFYEPNWLRFESVFTNYNFNYISIDAKYRDSTYQLESLEKTTINNFAENNKIVYKFDLLDLLKPFSSLMASYDIENYFFQTPDNLIYSDSTEDNLLNSIYILSKYLVQTEYIYKGFFTAEKYILLRSISEIKKYANEIFLRKQKLEEYLSLYKLLDPPISTLDYNPILLNAENRERYLCFKSSASQKELKLFDSTLIEYLSRLRTIDFSKQTSYNPAFEFTKPLIRNILIDTRERNNINDSLLISNLSENYFISKACEELSLDQDMFSFDDSSHQSLKTYSNRSLCIDNNSLDIKTSDTLRIIGMEKYLNKSIDSTANILWYFICENYQNDNISTVSAKSFEIKRKYDLYSCFSNQSADFITKLCSLDTLKKYFDYRYANSESFISSVYFDNVDKSYLKLYDLLLKPVEKYMNPSNEIKVILPSELITIPLDYIFSKRKGYLPKFSDYSSVYRAIYKEDPNILEDTDTTAIFSEFIYNDLYCNLNKKKISDNRGGIIELKYAKSEREGIEKHMISKSYIKNNGTKGNFLNILLDKSIKNVHLITHGVYIPSINTQNDNLSENEGSIYLAKTNDNPSERQLLIFSSDSTRNTKRNNILTAWEIRYMWDLSHINLVFLSACESGLIEDLDQSQSGYQGFINNFLERGVKSVIVSRWKIDDQFARDFSIKYYEILKKEKSYSKAFYKTKEYFYKLDAPPYLWSSFMFIQ